MRARCEILPGLVCSAATVCLAAVAAHAHPKPHLRLIDLNTTGQSALSPYLDAHSLAIAGSAAYFPAWSAQAGYELWQTDGTPAGTRLVADLISGTLSSAPWQFTPADRWLFFLASDGTSPDRVCVAGTDIDGVRIITDGDGWQGPITLIGALGERAFFTTPVADRVGLFAADRDGGITLLRTFNTGPLGPPFGGTDVTSHAGLLYFAADDGAHGAELWRTDGTFTGTELAADIVPGPAGSSPTSLAGIGGALYLAATTPARGEEPWVLPIAGGGGGGSGEPRMIADLADTPDPALSSRPSGFALVGRRIVFAATSAAGRELFVIDDAGSAGGGGPGSASLLADIKPGAGSGIPDQRFAAALVGGLLYFAADDGACGLELWVTDGFAPGTRLHTDLRPGPAGSTPTAITEFSGTAVFQAAPEDAGYRLWRAGPPGTPPELLSNLPVSDDPATDRTIVRPCRVLGGALLFPAFRADVGLELFRSLGQAGDAQPVLDIRTGTVGSSPGQFARLGRGATFAARTELGIEPWCSDGTAPGTRMLVDAAPGRDSGSPLSIIGGEHLAIFRVRGQWWRAAGVDDAAPEPVAFPLGVSEPLVSAAPRACELNGQMIFAGRTALTGDELFISDGQDLASGGTRLLADIVPGPGSSSPFGLVTLGDGSPALFFTLAPAPTGQARAELWRTDGTTANTRRIATLTNPDGPRVVSTSVHPVAAGRLLFFVASDGAGDELWVSDGSDEGTYRVADINPGRAGSNPAGLTPVQDADGSWRVFFSASDGLSGAELWVSGGAVLAADTRRVRDIAPGPAGSNPLTITAGRLAAFARPGVCFTATEEQAGWELYFSDGTETGTVRLTDVHPGPEASVQAVLGVAAGAAYFRVVDYASGAFTGQLYRSRGVPGAFWTVRDDAGRAISPFSGLLTVNNRAFLSAADAAIGSELAVLDLCPADVDNSGFVDATDIFAFLESWFDELGRVGPALVSDHTRDRRAGIDDLFVFVNEYFTGCD